MAGPELRTVLARIEAAERLYGRQPASVSLLAVSKGQPPAVIREIAAAGQSAFGENYLQEAQPKMAALADLNLSWHFIGRIQRNKTREIARSFDWVQTLDRLDIAQRLCDQRPADRPALQCLLEVNVSGEASKGGILPTALPSFAAAVRALPRLQLRGLMCLPAPSVDFVGQRRAFASLRQALDELGDPSLDVLSMGTSADFEAAIAEGATIVRVGTAIFGARS